MKKMILLGLLTFCTFTYAKMLDAIAVIVEGEVITTTEIRVIAKQLSLSKTQAQDILIQDRLQKSAMKDILIDEKRIDAQISSIAKQNNISISKMQKILKEQGTPWHAYRANIRNAMKKEKFFQENILSSIPDPSEDSLKLYYQNHPEEFFAPKRIHMIEYTAKTEQQLKTFLKTKKTKGITQRKITKNTKDLNPTLLQTILQTQKGGYTRPFNAGDRYISYKVLSKSGKVAMPFDTAKNAIIARWKRKQQESALKDYFEKLKTNADIQYIR